ncbi:MAG: isocitrate dehydrogenase (NADP(+)) [Methanobacteriota archaeon]
MVRFEKLTPPPGDVIEMRAGRPIVPDHPVIPYFEGDGIGPDVVKAALGVLDAAVEKAYRGKRKIAWFRTLAGEQGEAEYGERLPKDTLDAIRHFRVALKGPMQTPIGKGYRSYNVLLRQVLDLYACVRPVFWIEGVPAPVKEPQKMNVVIFRENTEDVYAGIEWAAESPEAKKLIAFIRTELGATIREGSGIGIKPMSKFGSERLVRRAIQYALDNKRRSVTVVHKGNIMKYTEGAFREWAFELAAREFRGKVITEEDVIENHGGKSPAGMVVIKDRIADNMLQQILTRTDEYDVLATPNLNGDYFSDACAAQVGGLGLAPGGNIGDECAVFEATHGTAPKYAGKDMVNPSSVILSGALMFEYMGWREAADLVREGIRKTVASKVVTYDLAREMPGVTPVRCSDFARAVARNM